MDMAEHAIVANGIVFTYGSGEDATQIVPDRAFDDPAGARRSAARVSNGGSNAGFRAPRRAALYALDALTGRELWNSGNEIAGVEPLQRPDDRERPRVHYDIRRHDLRLRGQAVRGPVMRSARRYSLAVICALASAVGWAQGRNVGFDWPATGADAATHGVAPARSRTSRPRTCRNRVSSSSGAKNWRMRPRQSASLSQGVTMNGLIGFTPASFVTGVSNNVFAVDNDTGFPVWHRRFDAQLPAPTPRCPGGMTGAAGRVVSLVREPLQLPAPPAARSGIPRRHRAPGEGVPMEIARRDGGAGLRGRRPSRRRAAVAVEVFRLADTLDPFTSSRADGTLHALGQSLGHRCRKAGALSSSECSLLGSHGDRRDAVHQHEQRVRRRREWRLGDHAGSAEQKSSARGRPMAAARLAISPSRRAARFSWPSARPRRAPEDTPTPSSRSIAKTLQPTDWFTSPSAEFVTTPVVISLGGREIVAAAARDGRVFLLDAASLGGATHTTPLFASTSLGSNFAPDALAAFEQPAGTPWLLVPTARAIVAFRIVQEGGKVALQQGWTSRDLAAPSGADRGQRRGLRRVERPASGSGGAVCIRLAIGSRVVEQRKDDDVVRAAGESSGPATARFMSARTTARCTPSGMCSSAGDVRGAGSKEHGAGSKEQDPAYKFRPIRRAGLVFQTRPEIIPLPPP